jgi:hypothetical protein
MKNHILNINALALFLLLCGCLPEREAMQQPNFVRPPSEFLSDIKKIGEHGDMNDSAIISKSTRIKFVANGWAPEPNRFGEYYGKMKQTFTAHSIPSEFGGNAAIPITYVETTFSGRPISAFLMLPVKSDVICATRRDVISAFESGSSTIDTDNLSIFNYDFKGANKISIMLFFKKSECVQDIRIFQNPGNPNED